jgi:hypothetical protein
MSISPASFSPCDQHIGNDTAFQAALAQQNIWFFKKRADPATAPALPAQIPSPRTDLSYTLPPHAQQRGMISDNRLRTYQIIDVRQNKNLPKVYSLVSHNFFDGKLKRHQLNSVNDINPESKVSIEKQFDELQEGFVSKYLEPEGINIDLLISDQKEHDNWFGKPSPVEAKLKSL